MSDSDKNSGAATAPAKPAPRRKLGKGLGALMGEMRREEPLVVGPAGSGSGLGAPSVSPVGGSAQPAGLANLAISSIQPDPNQPRKHFDEASLEELAGSIAARGLIQPVIVRSIGPGRYQLVAGERRWRAAQKAQVHEIPALIRELSERDVMALALIENIQREDLSPVEEARAYQNLAQLESMTQAEIARLVEKSRSHVANLLRLLSLPSGVLAHLEEGRLDMGHARALIGRENAEELANTAVSQKLTVRQVEKLARGGKAAKKRGKSGSGTPSAQAGGEKNPDIVAVEQHLEEFLGLPVVISPDEDPRTGSIAITFRTLDQLDLICQRLTGGSI